MNGPVKMYQTREIIRHDVTVEVPKCMYPMKNLLSGHRIQSSDHVLPANLGIPEQKYEMHPDMANLQIRQENILKQLAELKDQMLSLKSSLNTTFTTQTTSHEIDQLADLVINVNPTNPPYSLIILQRLWSNSIRLIIQTHLHSTVNSSKVTEEFVQQIRNDESNSLPKLLIRLIWKNVDAMELISSFTPILGEVNVLRFLSRVGPSNWNYEFLNNCSEIDSVLDICYLLGRSRTKTERASLLVSLNAKLGKTQFLCNRNEPSIADIAASCAIKHCMNPNDINVNLSKWYQRCEKC